RTGNGHPKVIAEHLSQVPVVNTADDHSREFELSGTPDCFCIEKRPAHGDLSLERGLQLGNPDHFVRRTGQHDQFTPRFTADAEDSLYEGAVGFYDRPLAG